MVRQPVSTVVTAATTGSAAGGVTVGGVVSGGRRTGPVTTAVAAFGAALIGVAGTGVFLIGVVLVSVASVADAENKGSVIGDRATGITTAGGGSRSGIETSTGMMAAGTSSGCDSTIG